MSILPMHALKYKVHLVEAKTKLDKETEPLYDEINDRDGKIDD